MASKQQKVTNSAILNKIDRIENKARDEYLKKSNLCAEMQNVLKSFFDANNRAYLPENPYPEIAQRFREIEVRVRQQKCAEIIDEIMTECPSQSLPKKESEIKLLNQTILANANVFGLQNVMNGIADLHWAQSICAILSQILSPINTSMDQCSLHKISLISSPIFFYDSFALLHKLSTEHVLFAHLLPRHKNKSESQKQWPYFLCNDQINVYTHIGITAVTFQKAVSVFAKFIQKQIFWIAVKSKKKESNHKNSLFWFKHLSVNGTHFWTFNEIFQKNRKKFETNIKHSVAQKQRISMIFYFFGSDERLIFECEVHWYFYFRDANKNNKNNKKWISFAAHSHSSVYHSLFVNKSDIQMFADLCNNTAAKNETFTEWQSQTCNKLIDDLEQMKYGCVIPYLHWLATLTAIDSAHVQFDDTFVKNILNENIIDEMRLILCGCAQLFQGFTTSVERIATVLHIIFEEIQQWQTNTITNESESNKNNNLPNTIDYRMEGESIHISLLSILERFMSISDFNSKNKNALYSQYLHCIPRMKYLLIECLEIIPSFSDLSKLGNGTIFEYLSELRQFFDLIGDTLNCEQLLLCTNTREWIQKMRKDLERPHKNDNNKRLRLGNILVVNDAINYNISKRKLPHSIPLKGTLLQYMTDTELDRWLSQIIFDILSHSFVSNPFVKIVINAQQMSFKLDSFKQMKDSQMSEMILSQSKHEMKEMSDTITDIQRLYSYHNIYGYKSALTFIDSTAMKSIYENICLQIPNKIMSEIADNNNNNCTVFVSLCGDIAHYPFFETALTEMEMTQNVFISGHTFEESLELFACHSWNLAQYLYKLPATVVFISLNIGANIQYYCDVIIKQSNSENTQKMLIKAAKSRQLITMDLMIAAKDKYICAKLNLFLTFKQAKTNRYRLCWPFKSDLIFTTLFFDINHAILFWRAYSVGNIANEYNLEHKSYKKELLSQLQIYHKSAEFDRYFHSKLRYMSLLGNNDCIIPIYRFFQPNTLCGISIESVKELKLIQKILKHRKQSRYVKNQMNRKLISKQWKQSVIYSQNIIFSDVFTFFDRAISNYLHAFAALESANNMNETQMYSALTQMINLFIPLKSASMMAWADWLSHKNEQIMRV